jgi:DNA processing protein
VSLLERPAIGVAGPRKASLGAIDWAERVGRAAATCGAVLVNGLAPGVDRAAAEAAARSGGAVVGILAQGIRTADLERTTDAFAGSPFVIISEFRPDSSWQPGLAMQRNLTICALTRGLFIIEPGDSGGTLNAGKAALQLGRKTFAVPTSKAVTGCAILASEGASVLEHPGALQSAIGEILGPHAA